MGALGSASSNNVSQSLPIILQSLKQDDGQDYLYLHSLKEILEHSENSPGELAPFASELWQKLFAVSQSEDNSAVGAECIGRLATIDPGIYVPELAKSLEDPNPAVRGTVISAFRFTLGETSNSYNNLLVKMMTPMLQTMLNDSDIANRRLAVTTLNAAIHNKPELVIPDIGQLLPTILDASCIRKTEVWTCGNPHMPLSTLCSTLLALSHTYLLPRFSTVSWMEFPMTPIFVRCAI